MVADKTLQGAFTVLNHGFIFDVWIFYVSQDYQRHWTFSTSNVLLIFLVMSDQKRSCYFTVLIIVATIAGPSKSHCGCLGMFDSRENS